MSTKSTKDTKLSRSHAPRCRPQRGLDEFPRSAWELGKKLVGADLSALRE
ncbi:MAG: hypothetical protein Q8Q54_12700 [Methylococcales bacterium]|nr:hypothetical protein [Methylococcales bacterium]MDP3839768.1 hypothetical protein [Methylococcales bacterium]